MREEFKIIGTIEIYEGKKEKLLKTYQNAFLGEGKKNLLDYLETRYSHFVIGTGTGETRQDMTQLQQEEFRKEITESTRIENTLVLDIYIEPSEANFENWGEIGLIADGTINEGTGILYNRARISEDNKNSSTSKTISWKVGIY